MEECSNQKCCCSCHAEEKHTCPVTGEHEEMPNWFFEVADEAWSEVLKDKIKEHILATQNARMTKLAKIVSEGNDQRWKNKMEKKQSCHDFHEQIASFFAQSKKSN